MCIRDRYTAPGPNIIAAASAKGVTDFCSALAGIIPMMLIPVSYTHLRAHETPEHLVCRLLLEKKKKRSKNQTEYTYTETESN